MATVDLLVVLAGLRRTDVRDLSWCPGELWDDAGHPERLAVETRKRQQVLARAYVLVGEEIADAVDARARHGRGVELGQDLVRLERAHPRLHARVELVAMLDSVGHLWEFRT